MCSDMTPITKHLGGLLSKWLKIADDNLREANMYILQALELVTHYTFAHPGTEAFKNTHDASSNSGIGVKLRIPILFILLVIPLMAAF